MMYSIRQHRSGAKSLTALQTRPIIVELRDCLRSLPDPQRIRFTYVRMRAFTTIYGPGNALDQSLYIRQASSLYVIVA